MEKMKINSKTRYNRARVRSGYGPHRMLKMLQAQIRESSPKSVTKKEVTE